MKQVLTLKHITIGLIISFILFYCPYLLTAQAERKGDLIGFVYGKDGTTPIQGAIVKIKNIQDGTIYESTETDIYGAFKIEGIKEGIYVAGIITPTEIFNADNLIGIKHDEIARVSFALIPPQAETTSSPKYVYEELPPKNEIRIGRVVAYDADRIEAWILIEEGVLRRGDNIRIRGYSVDFYQKVERLRISRSGEMKVEDLVEVDTVIAGQTVLIEVKDYVEVTDFVYLVLKKKKLLAFFLQPCTWAAVLAGTALYYSAKEEPEEKEPEISPFK